MRFFFVLFVLCACSSGGLTVPADRPTLLWSSADPNRGLIPSGFTTPDVHVCAADPARQYVGELFEHGINDVQVLWHWAPIIPGPNPHRPTLDQPQLSLSGALVGSDDSTDDVLGDH